jgi:hydroxyacylglutathione hydrolase
MPESNPPDAPPIRIRSFCLGPYETNCYVVADDGERVCWVVDAGMGPEPLIDAVRKGGWRLEAVVLTHAHLDHIAGVGAVLSAFPGTPVWIHRDEEQWLNNPELNLSTFTGLPVTAPGPDRVLEEGEVLSLGRTRWRVLHTPGHSPGGITLHEPTLEVAIVGDALFAGSVGRTDFPGSSFETLAASIREKLYTLPGKTRVLPGHGPETTIAQERLGNPFVRG